MNIHCCGNLRFLISSFCCRLSGHKNRQLIIYSWFQTSAIFWMLYAFFWINPQRPNFICQCFGTLRLFHLHRRVGIPVSFIPLACAECDDTLLFSGASSIPLRCMYTYISIKFRCRGITQKKAYNGLWFACCLAGVIQVVRCTDESARRLHFSCLKRQWQGWKWRVQLFYWVDACSMRRWSLLLWQTQSKWSVSMYSVTATVGTHQRFSAPVRTGPGAHPASYTMGTGSLRGVKWPGRGIDHPPHLVPRLKKE